MIEAIDELKTRARLVQKRIEQGDDDARERVRVAISRRSDANSKANAAAAPTYGDCLHTIARELGFQGFAHAQRVLAGDPDEADFGTFLYTNSCGAYLNNWQVDYAAARAIREEAGGFLVPFKRQFVVVGSGFVETLGLAPDDPDWDSAGWDLVRPRSATARARLYAKRLAALPRELSRCAS